MSFMLRTWPFNYICCHYHSTYLHLFQLATRLRDDATAKHTWCAHHDGGRTRALCCGPRKMQRWSMIKDSYPNMHVVCVLCCIILYHTLISMCIRAWRMYAWYFTRHNNCDHATIAIHVLSLETYNHLKNAAFGALEIIWHHLKTWSIWCSQYGFGCMIG